MKKYKALGFTLSAVRSAREKLSGLAKPVAEKFVTNVVFADGLLAERKTFRLPFPILAAFGILSAE